MTIIKDCTQFEYEVMKFPPTWLLNQNQASWNDTLTPTEIQDLMHSLSGKLSDYDYDTSSENVLGLISLIFKVRFNIIYFNKNSMKRPREYRCSEKAISANGNTKVLLEICICLCSKEVNEKKTMMNTAYKYIKTNMI